MRTRRPILLWCSVAALLLLGCQAAHMPVSEGLAPAERLSIQGRQGWKIEEHLWLGPFEAHAIDRSWVRGRDLTIEALQLNRRRQQYAFSLREGTADRWHVACETSLRRGMIDAEIVDIEFSGRSELTCTLRSADDPSTHWTLSLEGQRDQPLEGILTDDSLALSIFGTRKLRGGLPAETTTGYEIMKMKQPVGMVEVIGDGAVWLGEAAMEQRDMLIAVAAALLLLEDLRAHLPGETGAA